MYFYQFTEKNIFHNKQNQFLFGNFCDLLLRSASESTGVFWLAWVGTENWN